MIPKAIKETADILSKLPGIGPKQAVRCAFYLLRHVQEREALIRSIGKLEEAIKTCKLCRKTADQIELKDGICATCHSSDRNASLLCVVEEDVDLENIERSGIFKGRYFVLGGRVKPYRGETWLKSPRVKELMERVKQDKPTEVLLAMNPTPDGDFAALTLAQVLKPYGIKITRLAKGLPLGGEIEYADEETLKGALKHREELR